MNKILYEANYVGSSKMFLMNALGILFLTFGISGGVHRLKKKQDKAAEEVGFLQKMDDIMEYIILGKH